MRLRQHRSSSAALLKVFEDAELRLPAQRSCTSNTANPWLEENSGIPHVVRDEREVLAPGEHQLQKLWAKGIKVCERWRENFTNFIADMGPKPTSKHTIDRIDPKGDYEPTNCRWATYKEQFENTDNPKFHENIGKVENLQRQ